jgi:hypothetical protein
MVTTSQYVVLTHRIYGSDFTKYGSDFTKYGSDFANILIN